ncbi:TPA: hypothetical protein I8Y12_001737 [Raoultella planticola]|nr:hypothetical protein [Raoultella planticola]
MFSNLIMENCSTLNLLRIYGFYGGANNIQITERPGGGQIRYSQLHSWKPGNSVAPETQFLSGPAAQGAFLFCRRGENDDSAAALRADKGAVQNIDFRICDEWHKRLLLDGFGRMKSYV